jgi:TIR domain
MGAPVFISYSRADQSHNDWRGRLELYLAQARRTGGIEPWDDKRIEAGGDWRAAISNTLEQAQAAILLVGPGFLTSAFIRQYELPSLLSSARNRGIRIFPLVVGWCDYEHSELASFQAFNDVRRPLESLPVPDQNQVLNKLSVEVSQAVEQFTGARHAGAGGPPDLLRPTKRLVEEMDFADVAFRRQNERCRTLVNAVTARLGITEHLQFEQFLFRFHPKMNPPELFEFAQIRAVTDGPLADSNRRMLDVLMEHPALLDEIPALTALRQHLVFWLNKYERVFRNTPAMAVCYVGVEDGVPWPRHAEEAVKGWIHAHRPSE